MVKFALKNGHQKDMFYDEIGLCAQSIDTIQGSVLGTIGKAYAYVVIT